MADINITGQQLVQADSFKQQANLILSGFGLPLLKTALLPFGSPLRGGKDENYNLETFESGDISRRQDVVVNGQVIRGSEITSELGTPVFGSLFIEAPAWIQAVNGKIERFDSETIRLDVVLIDISLSKEIVSTKITGLRGSVKEFITNGDYEITIRGGFFSPQPNVKPWDLINQLLKIVRTPISLTVKNRFLAAHGIENMVITNYATPQREGAYGSYLFEISALSDTPFELKLKENNPNQLTPPTSLPVPN